MNATPVNPLAANADLLSSAGLLDALKLRTEAQVIAARFAQGERLADGTWIQDACDEAGECGVHYHGWRYEFGDGSAIVIFESSGFEVESY
jgi:hypothetical protein